MASYSGAVERVQRRADIDRKETQHSSGHYRYCRQGSFVRVLGDDSIEIPRSERLAQQRGWQQTCQDQWARVIRLHARSQAVR